MNTTRDSRPTDARRTSSQEDLVTAAAGAWLVLALFSDGWAHLNVPELESFFTPWHGALYAGFLAAASWVAVIGLRRGLRPPDLLGSPVATARRLPVGYPLAAAGVVTFGLGGVLDLLWHVAFGVEEGLDALLSPSHLTLFAGGVLLLSAPARAAWSGHVDLPTHFRERFPELLSLTLTTGLTAFFLLYTSPFVRPGFDEDLRPVPHGEPGHDLAELSAVVTLSSYLLTTALLVVPLLLLARRAPLPRGAITLLVGSTAWLSVALQGFEHAALAAAVTVAAALVDLLLSRGAVRRRLGHRASLPLLGACLPAAVWSAHLAALALTAGVGYPVALWTGTLLLTLLAGLVLGLVAQPAGDLGGRGRAGGDADGSAAQVDDAPLEPVPVAGLPLYP